MQPMTPKVPKDRIRKTARRRKVIEYKAQGKTIAEIATILEVSEKTVDRDLKSQDVIAFIDELIRQQIVDISSAKLPLRLSFRSDLLDKLLPKRAEILSYHKEDVTVNRNLNLTNYSEEDKTAILDAYRRLNKKSSSPTEPIRLH